MILLATIVWLWSCLQYNFQTFFTCGEFFLFIWSRIWFGLLCHKSCCRCTTPGIYSLYTRQGMSSGIGSHLTTPASVRHIEILSVLLPPLDVSASWEGSQLNTGLRVQSLSNILVIESYSLSVPLSPSGLSYRGRSDYHTSPVTIDTVNNRVNVSAFHHPVSRSMLSATVMGLALTPVSRRVFYLDKLESYNSCPSSVRSYSKPDGKNEMWIQRQ